MGNYKEFRLKLGLLSISSLLALAQVVAAAFPLMYAQFEGVSKAGVELLGTVPNFGTLIGLLMSGYVIKILGSKTTVLLGVLVYLVFGTMTLYFNDYTIILASRVLLGIGSGLFSALAISLLSRFFQGPTLFKMLGFQNATASVSSTFFSFTLSYFVIYSWHGAFAIYLLAVPVLFVFWKWVPRIVDTVPDKQYEPGVDTRDNNSLNNKLVLMELVVMTLAFFIALVAMSYKMPQLIVERHLGSVQDALNLYGFFTLISIPVSLVYGQVKRFFKNMLIVLIPLLGTIGYALIIVQNSILGLYTATILVGVAYGLMAPELFNKVSEIAPTRRTDRYTAIALIALNIGVFASPIVTNAISNGVLHVQSSDGVFYVGLVGFGIATLMACLVRKAY
ncbi:MFS transporter [Weissella cibaria]|uniref:MFS transporter n=1 Tax=Weissella cibaria TaxID=137591 RepID=UPI000BFFC83C|nr:MFS transporter [Weissella cibaria]